MLPQTQCRQCGFDGCRPYAAAIASAEADIDRCPPGGDAGVAKLARVTGRPVIPLDARRGTPKPLVRAVIDEAWCIGCTLCIQACPVDAIAGGAKRMHDVIAALCTGCELCLPPCPVDCIDLVPAGVDWSDDDAAAARRRHDARAERLARLAAADDGSKAAPAASPAATAADPTVASAAARRRSIVDAAVARAGQRRTTAPPRPAADETR